VEVNDPLPAPAFAAVKIAVTAKLPALVPVPPGVVTLTGPVVAPAGTIAWIAVSEATVKLAPTPLNATAVAPVKLVPLIVTGDPTGPLVGAKLEIAGGLITVNELALVAVPDGVVTVSGPVVAPAGTVAWIAVAEVTVKVALTPLNATAVAPVKLVPLIVTPVPTGPLAGVKPAMVGTGPLGSPPSHAIKVKAGVRASIPTSPVGYEPSVVNVNWETPFLKTSRVFPSAVSRHLSPVRIAPGVNGRTSVKPPSLGLTFPIL